MRGMILGLARLGELERQKLAFREQHKGGKRNGSPSCRSSCHDEDFMINACASHSTVNGGWRNAFVPTYLGSK